LAIEILQGEKRITTFLLKAEHRLCFYKVVGTKITPHAFMY